MYSYQTLKAYFLTFLFVVLLSASTFSPYQCKYNGHPLKIGPKGGCYYINKNGNKTYVDRSYCNC
jgi:hypothetical protein